MIRRYGPQRWTNVHRTFSTDVRDLVDIDASTLDSKPASGFARLRAVAADMDLLAREARAAGTTMRALGSGWALTNIAITQGILANTKLCNGVFEVADGMFAATYPPTKRGLVVVAQCGISIGELNVYLEVRQPTGLQRCLKTAGIGAGQTVVGAVSGNTHGSALHFGATPEFVVGIHLVTGDGKSWWLERATQPVMNEAFVDSLGARLLRSDEVFDAALVGFGAFGAIAAMAIETDPSYQLEFGEANGIDHDRLAERLDRVAASGPELHHYEFVFDPYSRQIMEAVGLRRDNPVPTRLPSKPVWILRDDHGLAPGDGLGGVLFHLPASPSKLTRLQFEQYRERALLRNACATPGQLFTATITYLEGYSESALAVPLVRAAEMVEVSSEVVRACRLPSISQVRAVGVTKATLGFTHHAPHSAVFEFAVPADTRFREFEDALVVALGKAGIPFAFHWSKNSGIDRERLLQSFGAKRVESWKQARARVFEGDRDRMRVFDNAHVVQAGLSD